MTHWLLHVYFFTTFTSGLNLTHHSKKNTLFCSMGVNLFIVQKKKKKMKFSVLCRVTCGRYPYYTCTIHTQRVQAKSWWRRTWVRYHASLHYISAHFICGYNSVCQGGTRHGRIAYTRTTFIHVQVKCLISNMFAMFFRCLERPRSFQLH